MKYCEIENVLTIRYRICILYTTEKTTYLPGFYLTFPHQRSTKGGVQLRARAIITPLNTNYTSLTGVLEEAKKIQNAVIENVTGVRLIPTGKNQNSQYKTDHRGLPKLTFF